MIFLDNNATTGILPAVVEAMLLDLDGIARNPSSITTYGREAKQKLIQARKKIADYFGVFPDEIIFTSGGTESNHLLINGFYKAKPGPIITTKIEHPSALSCIKNIQTPVHYLDISTFGAPTVADIEKAIQPSTSFIFLTGANNETGVLSPFEEVAELASFYNVPLLLDGVCLLGKYNLSPIHKKISAISFSGHKCHGPKGIGIAFISRKHKIPPLFVGGHQERNLRAGTENLPGILGLAKAIELIPKDAATIISHLRDTFESRLLSLYPDQIEINGQGPRIANTSNLYFKEIDAETLLIHLDQNNVIASLGSACSAGTLAPSHVLLEMGLGNVRARSSLRFSFSRLNTIEETLFAVEILHNYLRKSLVLV